ncbi:hypothetical protein CkaCkLH20_03665 [Colletotrichum karsti]|uniref:Secreted protein n=1 Tax=Colletotrichum karsti TaxID=1095194 RepID=A0A9P6IA34_9PEZI|nr:uncharacterized protein CkaCkLH20_03665 [Colletotrichum karsti]KAF9878765.1 hypothetical protein CkaCkLH20_03665 [Colletotrichum karsti]
MRFQSSALAAVAFLVLSVEARWHYSCTCHNGGSYIWRITSNACSSYNSYIFQTWPDSQNSVRYDTPSGRCTSVGPGGNVIDGDTMERMCKETAQNGFPCANNNAHTCFAEPDSVSSWCD